MHNGGQIFCKKNISLLHWPYTPDPKQSSQKLNGFDISIVYTDFSITENTYNDNMKIKEKNVMSRFLFKIQLKPIFFTLAYYFILRLKTERNHF